MVKIDPSRLTHLDHVRNRMRGAVSTLNDRCNALIHQRTEAMALITKLEGYLKSSPDPESIRHSIARARADLAKVEADLIAARAAEGDARQRSSAAGSLFGNCQRLVDNKGRLV